MKRIIPLLDEKANHSVLGGDYLDHGDNIDLLLEAFSELVQPRQEIIFRHPTQFYVVYINNLTDDMAVRIDEGLNFYVGYAGIADMNYGSAFKTFLSTMLVNIFIKHKRVILQGHEPDRDADEDVNVSGYPFE